MTTKQDRKMVVAQAWIEDTIYEKIIDIKGDLSVSSWVRRAIKAYLEAQENTPPSK